MIVTVTVTATMLKTARFFDLGILIYRQRH